MSSAASPSFASVLSAVCARVSAALMMVLVLGWPSGAQALDDPALEYHTITTPHFQVHYFAGLEELAWRTATLCEEAHATLSPLLAWAPEGRTHVNVTDKSDSANGFASVYGRNEFTVFGMPPESDSVLGYYDDWLRILVYHEYTHILHLDTMSGIPPYLNVVIGKQLVPNQILPRWFIEGLAVYYESATTGTGRIHSALFQMWLRAEALADAFMDLGMITSAPVRWPFGNASYLYGAFFVDFIARRHGPEVLTRFTHIYGGRLIPYSLNQTMKEASGETFEEMWPHFVAEVRARALAVRVRARAHGQTRPTPLTMIPGDHKFVRVRHGTDQLSFRRYDYQGHPTYATISADGKITDLFEMDGAEGPATWSRDGQHMFFSRATVSKNVYTFQDLYVWSARDGKIRQLTRFDRAREPALSPDGKTLAFVRNRGGTMELVLRDVDATTLGRERVVMSGVGKPWYDPQRWQQIATPEWTPDGTGLVFSLWRLDEQRRDLWSLRVFGPGAGELRRLTQDAALDRDPHFCGDGRLYFTSDRDGVFNVYAMDHQTRQTWKVSEVTTGVFTPICSQDGRWIYATHYTHLGYEIARFPRPAAPPLAAKDRRPPRAQLYPLADWTGWKTSDYAPARWLAPLLFTPDIAVLTTGSGFSGTISGNDPVGRHSYTLTAGWTTDPGFGVMPAIGLGYGYWGWAADLTLNATYQQYRLDNALFSGARYVPYTEQRALLRGAATYPISTLQDRLTLSTTYTVDWRGYTSRPAMRGDPGGLPPSYPEQGWFNELQLGVSYSYLEQFPYSISVVRGISGSLNLSAQHPSLGSDYESLAVQGSAYAFHQAPWSAQHVFKASVFGGFIETNFRGRRLYGIGGLAPQNVLLSTVFQAPTGGLVVRGYPLSIASGNQYFAGNAEYRFPIADLEQGFGTSPLFLRRLKGALFVDTGTAYDGYLRDATWFTSAGVEVLLQTVVGYFLPGTIRLGYAHGLRRQGVHDLYLLYGGGF